MNSKFVTTEGAISSMNLNEIEMDMNSLLASVGREAAEEMKNFTRPFDDFGTLTDSITWRTQSGSGRVANSEHMIDMPENKYAVDIGSKAPHAWFRENGTGPHTSSEGTFEFVAAIKEWAARKGMSEDDAEGIIFAIRKRGTAKHPFAYPMIPVLENIVKKWAGTFFKHLRFSGTISTRGVR